jgi:hypothetical protein
MAVTHGAATRNAIADAVLAEIDAGAGAGNLVFRTAGAVEVATLALSNPAGVVSGAVLTFSSITDDSSATGGTTTNATIEDDAAATVLACSVGTTGEDINLSSVVIGAGDTVSVSSLTYTAPV